VILSLKIKKNTILCYFIIDFILFLSYIGFGGQIYEKLV